ncbi:MAG: 50S ribosomal protein L10 [Candidatus Saganbacteria bacterium]|nr:50S ribosomal protein L10 [Candidatus Saganbacteria bacterium]
MANASVIEKKKQIVDRLKEKIDTASVIVVTDYRGITVAQLTALRRKLFAEKSELKIIKNTLLRRAMESAGFKDINVHLEGPTAVLFGYEDPVAPLKALVEFVDETEKGQIKAGLIEKRPIDSKSITAMSKLPPRDVLLAKVVGGFQAPIYALVNVLQGNIRKLVYALNAVKEKKGG